MGKGREVRERYKFEVSQGGFCLEDTVRSRVRIESDLRVKKERKSLSPLF